jgi:predicted ester cyclase
MGLRDFIDRFSRRPPEPEEPGNANEPFPGYDRAGEMELVRDLHLHAQAELEEIESYELSHKSRTRVLNKLHYLRQREPIPGYDDLSVEEITAALEEADLATIKNIRAYERKFHNRPSVHDAVEAARRRREDEQGGHAGSYHATSYGPSVSAAGSRIPGPGRLAANKAIVTSLYSEAIGGRDLDVLDRLIGEQLVYNGVVRGRAEHRGALAALLDAVPDLHIETELILAEEDLVSAHQRWTGTHQEAKRGPEGRGGLVEFTSTTILRIRDGLIAEVWDEVDFDGLLAVFGKRG